jgi:hypothetical protein
MLLHAGHSEEGTWGQYHWSCLPADQLVNSSNNNIGSRGRSREFAIQELVSSHLEKNSESKNHYWFWVFQNPPRTAGNTWNGQFLDSDWGREGIKPEPVVIKINQSKDPLPLPHCFWSSKHHSETKIILFGHVLDMFLTLQTSFPNKKLSICTCFWLHKTSVFEMKNSFNLDML